METQNEVTVSVGRKGGLTTQLDSALSVSTPATASDSGVELKAALAENSQLKAQLSAAVEENKALKASQKEADDRERDRVIQAGLDSGKLIAKNVEGIKALWASSPEMARDFIASLEVHPAKQETVVDSEVSTTAQNVAASPFMAALERAGKDTSDEALAKARATILR